MPPASSNLKKLSDYEVELVKKWIKQGAKYEKHWAFVAPKTRHSVPQVENKEWVKNPIDYFVLQKRSRKALSQMPKPIKNAC
jgi:hypothetical protein